MLHTAVRLVLATWLVMVAIVYMLSALGLTDAAVTRQWEDAAMSILCISTAVSIARHRRLPF